MLLLATAYSSHAKDITQPYRNLTLNANLELAEGKTLQDGVVLIVHGLMAHNRMEIIETSQQALLDNGHSSLAINLSLGVDNRKGFYDCNLPQHHGFDDAVDEIDAWVRWLNNNGALQITLMGHSLGGTQALSYAAIQKQPAVKRLILMAPATVGYQFWKAYYSDRYEKNLDQPLDQARKLIDAGKGRQLMENTDFLYCPAASVSAKTFYEYFRRDNKFDLVPKYLSHIQIPVLVIAASLDDRQPKVIEHVAPVVDNEKIKMVVIDGAGHFFRDLNLDEAIEKALEFIP
jgi:pimeloyl-ACP methyl ester carboxylesterase